MPARVHAVLWSCAILALAPRESAGQQYRPPEGAFVVTANQAGGSASIIELSTGRLVATVAVGDGPHEAAVSPDGRTAIITIYGTQAGAGNRLAVLDIATGSVSRHIDLGQYLRPHGAVWLRDGRRLVVTSEATKNLVMVDVPDGKVLGAIPTDHPGSHMVAVPRDEKRAYTANIFDGTWSEIDLESLTLRRSSAKVAGRTEGVAIDPSGSTLWLGSNTDHTVSIVDVVSGAVKGTLGDIGRAYRLALTPNGALALATDPDNHQVVVYDARALKMLGTIPIGDGSTPVGIIAAPDNRRAYLTLLGEGKVAEVDVVDRKVLRRFDAGPNPDGIGYGVRR